MKKQLLTLSILLCFMHYINAQNGNGNANANTQWKINGNNASTTDFMGTTNSQSLIFKTDNIARLQLDVQGKLILNSGKEMIINPIGLIRPEKTNPIAAYMLKVGGSAHVDGEVNAKQLFVQEYITYLKSLKGPSMNVDTIRMDSTRGIFGHTKIFGDVQIKQNLEVSGNATFKNTLTAEKGIMFDGVNGLRYTAPTATSAAKYNLGGGIYQPLSTACPTPHQNFTWFATQGAYISHIGANTQGASPLVDASITMMTAPWDGNGIIEVDGKDKNGKTNNGLLLNYFCGRDVGICIGANGGTVKMGNVVEIGFPTTTNLNTALTINQNTSSGNGVQVQTWNNSIKAFSILKPDGSIPFAVTGGGNTVINADNSSIKFFTINDVSVAGITKESFVVYGSGKTQIGSKLLNTSPHTNALLTVSGKMVAQSCYVTQLYWADFVFDKDYKLPKLSEIENYYKINGHLPQIPSEKEVKENGIDLGEMNKLLLQKIEELTILMVDQDKRIKELENKK